MERDLHGSAKHDSFTNYTHVEWHFAPHPTRARLAGADDKDEREMDACMGAWMRSDNTSPFSDIRESSTSRDYDMTNVTDCARAVTEPWRAR